MTVAVLVPAGLDAGDIDGAIHIFGDVAEVVRLLRDGTGPAVLWSDGLAADDAELVEAIRARGAPVIELRSQRWDGFTASPLSAACRGVISGFGANGLRAAVRVLAGHA